ncbi:MAG: PIN domain-containing protein [Gemmatimonas sp.]|nr:PIN domain-containing protein [Gemmatimonas sp.]
MNVVDSSGWIEYFTASPNADFFAASVEDTEHLLVASVSVLEVFRWVYREHGESNALRATALMQQGHVVDLDATLALRAAKLGLQHRLPLADSILLATAHVFDATLWTQDADLEAIPGVQYRAKSKLAE